MNSMPRTTGDPGTCGVRTETLGHVGSERDPGTCGVRTRGDPGTCGVMTEPLGHVGS